MMLPFLAIPSAFGIILAIVVPVTALTKRRYLIKLIVRIGNGII
ncbi:hypothetical protein [Fibrella forsythiae]|nr:hypothetical protein [Fibrella forsythiae]